MGKTTGKTTGKITGKKTISALIVSRVGRPVVARAAYPHLKRTELAIKSNIHIAHLCNVLSGKSRASTALTQRIAAAIGVKVSVLVKELERVRNSNQEVVKQRLSRERS